MKKYLIKQLILVLLIAFGTAGTSMAAGDEVPFSRFIKPVTNPVYFDEPQNISYIHVVNVYQDLPKNINTKLGRVPLDGYLNLTAIRATYALNEKFSLIAAKDGYITFKPDKTLDNGYGWADLSLGFKGALYYCPQDEFIVSGKMLFEFSNGTSKVYQGNGDGNVAPSISFLKGFDKWQLMGTLGTVIPFNANEESMMVYQSYHVSYAVTPRFFPLVELNHWCVARQADRDALVPSIVKFEAGDLANLGSKNGYDHRNLITGAVGFRYRIFETAGFFKNLDFGLAYELPLTNPNNGLMQRRGTADFVLHF
jgi:hypothetical protein